MLPEYNLRTVEFCKDKHVQSTARHAVPPCIPNAHVKDSANHLTWFTGCDPPTIGLSMSFPCERDKSRDLCMLTACYVQTRYTTCQYQVRYVRLHIAICKSVLRERGRACWIRKGSISIMYLTAIQTDDCQVLVVLQFLTAFLSFI